MQETPRARGVGGGGGEEGLVYRGARRGYGRGGGGGIREAPAHAQLKRRLVLARLLDPTWLVEKVSIIETLQTFIVLSKAEFYVQLLEDTKRMALLDGKDALELRWYSEKMGSELAVATVCKTFFAPPPPPA